jgi:hypothetical protein
MFSVDCVKFAESMTGIPAWAALLATKFPNKTNAAGTGIHRFILDPSNVN